MEDVLKSPLFMREHPAGVFRVSAYKRQKEASRRESQSCHCSMLYFLPQPRQTEKYTGISHHYSWWLCSSFQIVIGEKDEYLSLNGDGENAAAEFPDTIFKVRPWWGLTSGDSSPPPQQGRRHIDKWTLGEQLIEISGQLPLGFIIMTEAAVKHWWEICFKW